MQLDLTWLKAQGEDKYVLGLVSQRLGLPKTTHSKMGIAVSGGGDSMALLHCYIRLSEQTGMPIAAVTVDHTLREGSAEEAAQVGEFCARHNVSHDILTWDNWDGHGNLQSAARIARYNLLAEWARNSGVTGIALGHTKDDSAENFVMRLARKAGIDGLSVMDNHFDWNGIRFERPLWLAKREHLREYLTRNNVLWVDDPSNDNLEFERVRVRKALATLAEVGVTQDAIFATSLKMQDARKTFQHYLALEAAKHVSAVQGDLVLRLLIDPPLPSEMTRRLHASLIQWVGRLDYPPRHSTMLEMEVGLLSGQSQTLGGCFVSYTDFEMRITREHNAVRGLTCPTDQLWDKRWQLNGPHALDLHIAALGDAVKNCPDWRDTGLPRTSLLASPAIWRDDTLIAAPVAGLQNGWTAQIVADFHSSLLTH